MGFFHFFKTCQELECIISRLEANKSNNYKDAAQSDLKELEAAFLQMKEADSLSEKQKTFYESKISAYRTELKGYSHKDQKPFWT